MLNKKYLAIIALLVLLVALIVAIYAVKPFTPNYQIGVKAGDVFTYKMTGVGESYTDDIEIPENYMDINNVEYYRIEITNVEYPFVSYKETTQFKNGTSFSHEGTLNVQNGDNTSSGGFWGIFIANLKVNSLSRPAVSEGIKIDSTEERSYLDGKRQTNFLRAEAEFYDTEDETLSRTCNKYTYIYVDKELGILVELKEMEIYNDPQIMLTTTWELIDSNVLRVP
jgi:hypothetical protein